MSISITSPNVDNYTVAKGKVEWKPTGSPDYIHMGNAPQFRLSPSNDKLDHFSSMTGIRNKDKSVIIERTSVLAITLEEFTPQNMGIFLMGEAAVVSDLAHIDIGSVSEVTGSIRYTGQNDIGPKWVIEFPNVSFTPTGDLDMIADDDWSTIELEGEVLWDSDNNRFGTADADFGAIDAPVNVVPPYIYASAGLDLADVIHAFPGTWIGATSYTYQWKNAGVDIGGATNATYTITAPDSGDAITCVVTAHGLGGTTPLTSNSLTAA